MSPAPITQDAAASASSPQQQSTPQAIARKNMQLNRTPSSRAYNIPASAQPVSRHFDDIFHAKFMQVIADWKNDPSRGSLTQKDRKTFIENAYNETDELYFSRRQLSDQEIKLRALTKVFYKILAEEPWSEDWIRAPDVERKLSRFEMHRDSIELAAKFNVPTPREAVRAAREAAAKQEEALKAATTEKEKEKLRVERGPWDDIEIIYIPGTVSAAATSRLNRDDTYPISVSSVAATLQSHICRDMVRPFSMAERFVNCSDTQELEQMREFACNVCDYCPHLLDNDNVSLLVVLLILSRSDVCKRWENNGIRIEGSTISHRKSECMKNKLGWNTTELKKPFDNFATEFQTRVKNACFPAPRAQRGGGPKSKGPRKSSTPATPSTPTGYGPPPAWAYMPSPQIRQDGVNTGINVPAPAVQTMYKQLTGGPGPDAFRQPTLGDAGGLMDLS
ncbi:hypothetical protein N0V91_009601 [Didymella pomorum]|jgi:hypothetical protein|uniref:Uncharacterized protein n=1 Tax=Didymella pomorum TaxID=749634 RepID=A0A9W9D3R4_9PLEO|nr:hypothetical protein N0V91_009601 [Didymella pomorum]